MPRECGHQSEGQQYLPLGVCPLCDLDFAMEAGDVARKTWRHRRAPLVQWMRENGRAEWPPLTMADVDRLIDKAVAAGYRPAQWLRVPPREAL